MGKLKKLKEWIISDALNGLLMWTPNKLHKFKERGSGFLAFAALVVVSVVWGTTWVVSKKGIMLMPALQLAGIRQLLAGSLYLLYFILKKYPLPSRSDLMPLIVLSLLNFVLSNGLSTWGIKYISAGLGSIIGAIFPLWIVLISMLVDHTKPPKMAVWGMVIGFAGICIIFYNHLADLIDPRFRFGIFLSLIATWSWAFGTIYTKKYAKVFNPYFGLGFQMLLSGLILTIVSAFDPNHLPLDAIPQTSWFAIFYLVIFGSLVGFICYLYALQHLPTEQTAIYAYINPVVALLTGWLVLDESVNLTIFSGCLVTILGVFLVNRSFR